MMRGTTIDIIGGDAVVVPPLTLPPNPASAALPSSLHEAYVRIHTMMKLVNLRVGDAVGKRWGEIDAVVAVGRSSSDLIPPPCTQTWPGRLSAPPPRRRRTTTA